DGGSINTTLDFSLIIESEIDIGGLTLTDETFASTTTYHVTDTVFLEGDTVIEPGTRFKVDPNVLIRVNNGTLSAAGTSTNPIVFTSASSPESLNTGNLVSVSPTMGPKTTVV